MPSPFPGMDPYLEGEFWGAFHTDLATEVKRLLIPQLKPRYYPFTDKYFLVDAGEVAISEEKYKPDIAVAKKSESPMPSMKGKPLAAPLVMRMPKPRPKRIPHYRVAIRDLEKRKLVTVIEFLSPVNKRGLGRRQYLEKRALFLSSPVNLVEVDLLRQGTRLPMQEPYPPAHYFVILSRVSKRPDAEVWPIVLDQVLPKIPIPLRKKEKEATLDLQQAVSNVYDLDSFDTLIDYSKAPPVPLSEEEMQWAREVLKSKVHPQ